MLFDPGPKDNLKDLYGREKDVSKMEEALLERKSKLIIISGLRRVGKTSLMKAVLKERIKNYIIIDPRHLAPRETILKEEVLKVVQSSMQNFLDENEKIGRLEQLKKFLRHIRGINVDGLGGIEFDFSSNEEVDLQGLFRKLDEWADGNGSIVLAIDEAQEFVKLEDLDLTGLLAYIYENCKNIQVILTGSEMGLLYQFLKLDCPDAYFFGRIDRNLPLDPLESDRSKQFLVEGFKEKGYDVSNPVVLGVLDKAVDSLDGIIGWLNMFANKCLDNHEISEKYISEVQEIGSKMSRSEFDKFLARINSSKRSIYRKIMKDLVTSSQYKFIKLYVDNETRKPCVDVLIKEEYIMKIDKNYLVKDPLLGFSFEN